MGAIKKEMLSDEQFVLLLWHFDQYKKNLEAVGERELKSYNFMQRREFKKVREKVIEFWNELDKIN